jgi:hypothetical protein
MRKKNKMRTTSKHTLTLSFVCEFGGEGFETKEGESGKNKGLWEGRVVGILFSSYYKILII